MSSLRVNNIENSAGVPCLQFDAAGNTQVVSGLGVPQVTNATRPTAPFVGTIVYNTDAKITQIYTGAEVGWTDIGTAAVPFQAQFQPLVSSPQRNAPTSIGSTYAGTSLDGQVSLSGGIQLWTVPYTGNYRIKAYGAQGGSTSNCRGGGGAFVQGEFSLTEGEIIKILCGIPGPTSPNDCDTGGGGATYVIKSPYNNTASILLIAAGGGGASNSGHNSQGCGDRTNKTGNGAGGKDGQITNAGVDGAGGNAGSNGYAGDRGNSGSARGNPGGGFFGGGNSGSSNPTWGETTAGQSFLDGAIGGQGNDTTNSFGGFGGGGGGHGNCFISGGGGGGYNGGGCQVQYTSRHGGCGGGSYNAGSNQIGTSGANYISGGIGAFGYVDVEIV